MVDEEASQSILDILLEDVDAYNETGYVILVNGRWEPGLLSEEELEAFTSPPPD